MVRSDDLEKGPVVAFLAFILLPCSVHRTGNLKIHNTSIAAPELLKPDGVLLLLATSDTSLPIVYCISLSSFCACLSSEGHRHKGGQSTSNPPPIPGSGCNHIKPDDLQGHLVFSIEKPCLLMPQDSEK